MFPSLSPMEMIVIGGLAVLLFGKRLPEVGRSLGRSVVELKKGMRGVEDELSSLRNEFRDSSSSSSSNSYYNDSISSYNTSGYATGGYDYGNSSGDLYDRSDVTVPKFEPPRPASTKPEPAETPEGVV